MPNSVWKVASFDQKCAFHVPRTTASPQEKVFLRGPCVWIVLLNGDVAHTVALCSIFPRFSFLRWHTTSWIVRSCFRLFEIRHVNAKYSHKFEKLRRFEIGKLLHLSRQALLHCISNDSRFEMWVQSIKYDSITSDSSIGVSPQYILVYGLHW